MLSKEKLLETIRQLPDQISIEELFERIIFIQKVELGLHQSKEGQIHSTEDARKKLDKWLPK
jgi:hypothetical protein